MLFYVSFVGSFCTMVENRGHSFHRLLEFTGGHVPIQCRQVIPTVCRQPAPASILAVWLQAGQERGAVHSIHLWSHTRQLRA